MNNPELNIKLINQCNEGYTEQEINNVKKFLGKIMVIILLII